MCCHGLLSGGHGEMRDMGLACRHFGARSNITECEHFVVKMHVVNKFKAIIKQSSCDEIILDWS